MLKILKIFEYEGPCICFIVNQLGRRSKNKDYLIIDLRQNSFSLDLSSVPPKTPKKLNTATSQILRKYIGQSIISAITSRTSPTIYTLTFHQNKILLPKMMIVEGSKPPRLNLVDTENNVSLLRFGCAGTFTKRKAWLPDAPSHTKIEDMLDQILEAKREQTSSVDSNHSHKPSDDIPSGQKDLKRKIKRRIKTLNKSYQNHEKALPSESDIDIARQIAEKSLDQKRSETMGACKFSPEMDKRMDTDTLFRSFKRKKRSRIEGIKQLELTASLIADLERYLSKCEKEILSQDEIDAIHLKFNLKKSTQNKKIQNTRLPFRTYRSSSGQPILVGKQASDNDLLTKKAKSNDYWLHTATGSGSHVIIRNNKKNQALPPATFKEAAILALHFSSLRNDERGEVYLTTRKNLKKTKDLPPGKWRLLRSETIFINYTQEELQRILKTLKQ